VVLPEKRRQCYNGYSSGDCIGFITAMPVDRIWRVSRRIFSFNLEIPNTQMKNPTLQKLFRQEREGGNPG